MGKVIQYAGADLYPKQRAAIFDPARIVLVEAGTKVGKGHPLDTLIYTPDGPKCMGDIHVGDVVLTPTGTATVMQLFPLGERDIYEVAFRDGSVVECTEDHLWEVESSAVRVDNRNEFAARLEAGLITQRRPDFRPWPRTMTTKELRAYSAKRITKIYVPPIAPATFRPQSFPIHPYLVGVLIGDGGLKYESVNFSSADPEIIERVRETIDQRYYEVVHSDRYDYKIRLNVAYQRFPESDRLIPQLRALGLMGKGSHEKGIPACYRYNTTDVRWQILQGIMDTDGSVNHRGQPMLEQTSALLAQDVQEVVESLGGYVRMTTKRGSYVDRDGNRVECRTVYRQAIVHPNSGQFFTLDRKVAACKRKKKHTRRYLEAVRFSRKAEAQCIAISDPRGLYLTEHLIPTHNTVGALAWLAEKALIEGREGRNYWWTAPVFGQADIAFRRMKLRIPRAYGKPNQSKLTITLANGARIWFKSAERPDDLYGEDVYAAVMDEASRMREAAWHAIRSTLTFTQGPVRMLGNVKGRKNFFYKLAREAERGADGMAFHRITAWDAVAAGILSREEIEAAHRDFKRLGREGAFNQLYLAIAADDGDNPFGLEAIEMCVLDGYTTTSDPGDSLWTMDGGGYPKAAGVDLAGRGAQNLNQAGPEEATDRDYTALVLLDRDGRAVHVQRFRKPHTETATEIHRVVRNTMALVDSTGAGDQQVEGLQRRGDMRVEGYTFTDRSRQDLLEGLALRIGEQAVRFPDGWLRDELDSFEFRYEARGIRYAVSEGAHDDGAMALALAVKKLPWKRRSAQAPLGVAKPGGSAWTGDGSEEGGDPLLGGSENRADPSAPTPIAVPSVVVGVGSGKWSGAG